MIGVQSRPQGPERFTVASVRDTGAGVGMLVVETIAKIRRAFSCEENLDLDELVADRAWEVLYVFAPVPIRSATGSPGSPIAIR